VVKKSIDVWRHQTRRHCLLNRFAEGSFLKNKFVLKGGTAFSLFCFNYPRLYHGRQKMLDNLNEKKLGHVVQENCVRDICVIEYSIVIHCTIKLVGIPW
jgi:hypothetical protein